MNHPPDFAKEKKACLARFEGHDYEPDGPQVFVWHVHHDTLMEPLTEPIAERVKFILETKPSCEIETRLRWLAPVIGPLPGKWAEAQVAWAKALAEVDKAAAELDKALIELDKARAEWHKARAECHAELEALHAQEHPGCPWDGTSLFPR